MASARNPAFSSLDTKMGARQVTSGDLRGHRWRLQRLLRGRLLLPGGISLPQGCLQRHQLLHLRATVEA